jgi:hypothetical protein
VLVFPQQVASWKLMQESVVIIAAVLEGEHGNGGGAHTTLQQPLFEALLHAAGEPDCVVEGGESYARLCSILRPL